MYMLVAKMISDISISISKSWTYWNLFASKVVKTIPTLPHYLHGNTDVKMLQFVGNLGKLYLRIYTIDKDTKLPQYQFVPDPKYSLVSKSGTDLGSYEFSWLLFLPHDTRSRHWDARRGCSSFNSYLYNLFPLVSRTCELIPANRLTFHNGMWPHWVHYMAFESR